uniref:Uncharacterized protein n=1 Tax=Anguilla anguilla TaxID=7936 RepID=A0A0E9W611_ANGAN
MQPWCAANGLCHTILTANTGCARWVMFLLSQKRKRMFLSEECVSPCPLTTQHSDRAQKVQTLEQKMGAANTAVHVQQHPI